MANVFSKVAADTLGISDIGKIIDPKDFDKVDGDDYIFNEDQEKIFFVIKSKADEYVFTNYALLHVDGDSAVSKKRKVQRYEYLEYHISGVTLETAGTVDLDVELKWYFNDIEFSVDVDKKQLEQLKDLYKALYEIGRVQSIYRNQRQDDIEALNLANDTFSKSILHMEHPAQSLKEIALFNQQYLQTIRTNYRKRDFSEFFEKYINN